MIDLNTKKTGYKYNGSQFKNSDISGAIFTLSLSIRIGRQRCQGSLIDSRYFPWAPSVAEKINRFVLNDINFVPNIFGLAIHIDNQILGGF